jgi:hypothetical protein
MLVEKTIPNLPESLHLKMELYFFVVQKNTVSEKEQRWGSKTIQGSGHIDSVDIQKLREEGLKPEE